MASIKQNCNFKIHFLAHFRNFGTEKFLIFFFHQKPLFPCLESLGIEQQDICKLYKPSRTLFVKVLLNRLCEGVIFKSLKLKIKTISIVSTQFFRKYQHKIKYQEAFFTCRIKFTIQNWQFSSSQKLDKKMSGIKAHQHLHSCLDLHSYFF